MSDFHAYMWSVSDWRTDEMYNALDNREQGILRNLFDECWVAGSIPSDTKILARISREPEDYFLTVWVKIAIKFRTIDGGKKLISARLEQDRRRLMRNAKFTQKRARKAAETRWSKVNAEKKINATSIDQASLKHEFEQCHTQTHIEENSSFQDLSNPEVGTTIPPTPPAKRREPDQAFEFFVDRHKVQTGSPYVPKAADFIQLAVLRKAHSISARASPEGWAEAVGNYFASPLSSYTLADLAVRFPTFRNSRLDRFNKPVNHMNATGGSNGTTKTERNRQAAERLRARFDSQDSGGGIGGDI